MESDESFYQAELLVLLEHFWLLVSGEVRPGSPGVTEGATATKIAKISQTMLERPITLMVRAIKLVPCGDSDKHQNAYLCAHKGWLTVVFSITKKIG